MTDINQSSWSEIDGSNTTTPPAGWPAGMLGTQVEPTGRAMMGAIKRWYDRANATVTSGGSANAQTLSYAVAPTSLVAGDGFVFIAGFSNTGTTTLNVNSLGAIHIKLLGIDLTGGEILAGSIAQVFYDGTNFQLTFDAGTIAVFGGATGAWTAFTPTFSASVGTFTSAVASGRYRTIGRIIFLEEQLVITTNGTASGNIAMSLPFTAASGGNYVLPGRAIGISGKALTGTINAGQATMTVVDYNNVFPGASGETLTLTGVYESS